MKTVFSNSSKIQLERCDLHTNERKLYYEEHRPTFLQDKKPINLLTDMNMYKHFLAFSILITSFVCLISIEYYLISTLLNFHC